MPDDNPSKPARPYKPCAPTPDQGKPPQNPIPTAQLSNRVSRSQRSEKAGNDRAGNRDRVMAAKTVFVVQAFETHRKKFVPTTKTEACDEASATCGFRRKPATCSDAKPASVPI